MTHHNVPDTIDVGVSAESDGPSSKLAQADRFGPPQAFVVNHFDNRMVSESQKLASSTVMVLVIVSIVAFIVLCCIGMTYCVPREGTPVEKEAQKAQSAPLVGGGAGDDEASAPSGHGMARLVWNQKG